jgi:3-phenylpropionate/trans-cinnamate dioxygenase ferredoxin subunit
MADIIEVTGANKIKNGQMKMFHVGNKEIVIAKVNDRYYAANNRCPHMGGQLSQGKLEGTIVTCPRHHSQFDLTDGHVVRWTDWSGIKLSLSRVVKSPRPLKMYGVRVEGNKVFIDSEEVLSVVS